MQRSAARARWRAENPMTPMEPKRSPAGTVRAPFLARCASFPWFRHRVGIRTRKPRHDALDGAMQQRMQLDQRACGDSEQEDCERGERQRNGILTGNVVEG